MGDALIRSLSSCASFVQNIKTQVHEISQIKKLMHTHFKAFFKALNNMNNALNMFECVFIPNSPHNVLFRHKILSFSQIDTIEVKLEPINDLFSLLGSLQSTEDYCDRLSIYWELYLAHKKPATLKRRLKECFKIVEELLPLINDLNLTIFGSAQRIKHPILKKAWMLAGQNQLNDSSLSKNILQDNLYMLLKLEIDESSINHQKKQMYKSIIRRIVADIDNRGASEGDGHISIAELNDLPDEVLYFNTSQSDDNNISNKVNKIQSIQFKSGNSDIWGLQYHPEISYDKMISLIKFRKERLINVRKCFENEEEVKNHIDIIQKENEISNRESRMLEIKNWLGSLN